MACPDVIRGAKSSILLKANELHLGELYRNHSLTSIARIIIDDNDLAACGVSQNGLDGLSRVVVPIEVDDDNGHRTQD